MIEISDITITLPPWAYLIVLIPYLAIYWKGQDRKPTRKKEKLKTKERRKR